MIKWVYRPRILEFWAEGERIATLIYQKNTEKWLLYPGYDTATCIDLEGFGEYDIEAVEMAAVESLIEHNEALKDHIDNITEILKEAM